MPDRKDTGELLPVYTFDIALTDARQKTDQAFALRVGRHPSETLRSVVARLVAYCVEFREGIVLVGELCQGDRPALEVRDFSGRVRVAGFVGVPSAARVRATSRSADRVVVYATGQVADLTDALGRARGVWCRRVDVVRFDDSFLDRLARLITRRTRIVVAVDADHVAVRVGQTTFDSRLVHLVPQR